jgi:hypothetical protein
VSTKLIDHLFDEVNEMMQRGRRGPEFWYAASLLLLLIFSLHEAGQQDKRILIQLSLGFKRYGQSFGMSYNDILDELHDRAIPIWEEALAKAAEYACSATKCPTCNSCA